MKISGFFLYCMILITHAGYAQRNGQQYKDSLVQELSQSPVTSSHVGKAGKFSASYQTFLRLLSSATEEELHTLTQHPSPTVRVYSYYALKYKHAPQKKEVKKRLVADTGAVNYMRGCLKGEAQVRELVKGKNTLYSRTGIKTGLTYVGRSRN